MKKVRVLGIVLIIISIVLNYKITITGFATFVGESSLSRISLIMFLIGACMIAFSRVRVTGGLEKLLDDDTVGVITFVRHGEKDDKGELTDVGKLQAALYGATLKQVYDERKEGEVFMVAATSPVKRVYDTVAHIMSAHPQHNPSAIMKDERLTIDMEGEAAREYSKVLKDKGAEFADNWYVNSDYGEEVAEQFASFLESNRVEFEKLNHSGKRFHYIAGTHRTFVESLLKRVLIKDGRLGFDDLDDIGGGLEYAEPINFILRRDGSYKVNLRGKVYDVDMEQLHTLVQRYHPPKNRAA